MPPLVMKVFVPLRIHSSLRLVVDGSASERAHVRTGVGLGDAEGGEIDLAVVALEAEWEPFAGLFWRAVRHDSGDCERAAKDREADAGVTPSDLLHHDGHEDPGRVAEGVGDEVEGVQTHASSLLDDRPRGLLSLVPFVGGWPDHALGEVVHPRLGSVAGPRLVERERSRDVTALGGR